MHLLYKMEFKRKVRVIAVESSVVLQESVRIVFLVAELNGIQILMSYIGFTPKRADYEKVYTVTGLEFD